MPEKVSKLLILGAGGFGQAVAETAMLLGQWPEIYFADDCRSECSQVKDFEIISDIKNLENLDLSDVHAIAAVGNNQLRRQWNNRLKDLNFPLATIVHPHTWISPSVQIGLGAIIMAGCAVGTAAKIGEGVILNSGALLDHDVVIGQYAHLSLGVKIAGAKKVEEFSFLEAGTIIGH